MKIEYFKTGINSKITMMYKTNQTGIHCIHIPGVPKEAGRSNISRNFNRIEKLKNASPIFFNNLTNDTKNDPHPHSLGVGRGTT